MSFNTYKLPTAITFQFTIVKQIKLIEVQAFGRCFEFTWGKL